MSYARPIKVTPSGLEDEAFQAAQAGRKIVDARGIPFPDVTYRPMDSRLLGDIARKAFAAWRDCLLTPARAAAAAAVIDALLREHFPDAEMLVFARHGAVTLSEVVNVQIEAGPQAFQKPAWLDLPAPRAMPILPDSRRTLLVAQVDGLPLEEGDLRIPVPAAAIGYFADVVCVRGAERPDFLDACHWVGTFKVGHGRFPRWREIGEQFPRIGKWMDKGRAARG